MTNSFLEYIDHHEDVFILKRLNKMLKATQDLKKSIYGFNQDCSTKGCNLSYLCQDQFDSGTLRLLPRLNEYEVMLKDIIYHYKMREKYGVTKEEEEPNWKVFVDDEGSK